ncbi:MAG: VWA domain-containing protein [archaeon]|nr:VWA domain-containing protein [archaeon]
MIKRKRKEKISRKSDEEKKKKNSEKLVSIVMAVIMLSSVMAGIIPSIAMTSNSTEDTTAPLNGTENSSAVINETANATALNETAVEETSPASSPEPTLSLSSTPSQDNKNDYRGASVTSSIHTTTVAPLAVEWGQCGPIDLVIVLDDTGSMGGAINSIKAELPNIIATANNASGGDLRMGYITFEDDVTVHNNLTTNISAVMDSINATTADAGAGGPEASDEAKNTAVNNLPAGTRNDAAGNSGTQTGDFTTPYRAEAVKIVVLITDAPPGGFNDVQDPADNVSMHTHAVMAKSKDILMSDVFVPTGGDYAGQAAILEDDANTTGGVFITTAADGSGTGAAINDIIAWCGEAPPTLAIQLQEDDLLINGTTTVIVNSSGINKTVNLTLNATAVSNGDTLAEYNLTIGPDGMNTTTLTAGSTPHAGMITAEMGNITATVTYTVDKLYLDVTVTDKVLTKGMGTLSKVNIKNPTDQAVDDIKVYFDVCSPDSTHTTLANWEPLAILPGHTTVTPYTVKYEVQGREIYVKIEDSSGTVVKEYGPFATGENATSTPFTFLAKIKYISETQTENDDELIDLITLTEPGKKPVVNITDITVIAPNGNKYTNLLAYPWDKVRYNVTLQNPSTRGNITYAVKIDDPANHISEDIEIAPNTTITKTLTITDGLTEGKKAINVSVTSGTAKVIIGRGFDVVMPHASFTIKNVNTGETDRCINATRGQTIRVTYIINNTGNYKLGDDVGEPSGNLLFRVVSSDGKEINLDQNLLLIDRGLTTIQKTYTVPTTGELGIYKVKAGFRMGKGIAPGPVLSAETQAEINAAIDDGLAYLRNTQNWDGSWGSYYRVGTTSLAVLSFLGHGISETDPDVRAGIDYILTRVQADGSIYDNDNTKTYETSLAITALARTNNPAYATVIDNAKDWLVSSQWDESCLWESVNKDNWYYGGFGYGTHTRPDLSNTQFALVALKAAGLSEGDETWDKAIIFLQRCQNRQASNDQSWTGNDGGFIYHPGHSLAGGTTSYGSMTAAGIWALRLCDVSAEDGRVEDALKWFDTKYTYSTNPNLGSSYYHYYLWSAAKAFILSDVTDRYGLKTPTNPGDEKGWYYDFATHLVSTQATDGRWYSSGCGDLCDTSFALLVLERELGFVILKGDEVNFLVDVDEVRLSDLEINPNPAGLEENVTVSFNATRVCTIEFDNEFGNEIWFEPSVVVPLPTGDLETVTEERDIESPHPYPSDYDKTWIITKPGAEQIRVHFDYLKTAGYDDKVRIYDGNDNLIATYYSYYWGNLWTPWVTGDAIKVKLTSDSDSYVGYGFSIDSIQFKRPELIPHEYNGDLVSIGPGNTTRVNVTIPGLNYTGTYDVTAFVDVYLKEDGNYFNYSVGPDVHGDDYLYGDFEVKEPARIVVTDLEVPDTMERIVSEDVSIESPHPYPSDYDETRVIEKTCAGQIRVHFDYLETAEYDDRVWIYDGNDNLIATYTYYWGSLWTPWVTGDTIKVRLTSDYDSYTDYGFSIDSIEYKQAIVRPDGLSFNASITVENIGEMTGADVVEVCLRDADNESIIYDMNTTAVTLDGGNDTVLEVPLTIPETGGCFEVVAQTLDTEESTPDNDTESVCVCVPGPRIIVTDLEVPGLINGGESFIINVTVENIGGLPGNNAIEVNLTDPTNESIIYDTKTTDVTLDAGENATVQLQLMAPSKEGRYAVIAQTLDTGEPTPDDDETWAFIVVRNVFATGLSLSSDEDVRMTSYWGKTSTLAVHHGDNLTCEVVLENFGANETTETLTIGVYLVIPYYYPPPSYGYYESMSVTPTPVITPEPTPPPVRPPYPYIEKIPVLTKNREVTLASGNNTTEVFELVVPEDARNGLYILRAWTHNKGVQTPNDIADWWSQLGPYETSGQLSVGYGEVEITDIEAKPGIVDAKDFVNIRITVKNIGDAKITDTLFDEQYYPLIVNISSNITTTCHAKEIGILYPGQNRTISFIFFNTEEYGRYDVNATVDASSYGLAGFEYISGGWNDILETPVSGDDYIFGELYPGPDGVLESVPAGDDYVDWSWWEGEYYINPGVNNILETPVSGDDVIYGAILPGENGVIDSVPGGDDEVSMEIVPASVDTRSAYSTVFYVASFDVEVSNTTVITGTATDLTVNVSSVFDGTPINGAEVTLKGAGVDMMNTTDSSGMAIFTDVNATQSGIIKVIAKKGEERGIAIIKAITVIEFDPADTNKNRVVSMVELMIAIGKWKAGTYSMTDLMTSIARWKAGSY